MRIASEIAFLFAAAMLSSAAVENGTFEFSAAGWKNVSGEYRFERTAGRNGTGALVFESKTPAGDSAVPEQLVPVVPGRIYDFEAWLKPEGLEKPGATVRMSLLTKDGKKIMDIYTGGARGTADWKRLSVRLPRLRADAAFARLRPCAWPGAVGRCAFDDIDVHLYVARPVGLMKSTAYRDEAADGRVTFVAETSLDCAEGCKSDDAYAEFVWHSSDGNLRRTRADSFDGLSASWTCDVASLAFGTNDVTCELKTKTGRTLGANAMPFARLRSQPRHTVMFDAQKRTLVNGMPFFPLGIFMTPFDTNAICRIAESSFNCIMPYAAPDKAGLDFCQAKGLKVFYTFRNYPDRQNEDAEVALKEEKARLLSCVEMVKRHPAVLAWFINDERPLSTHGQLLARYRALREMDLDHPVWSVLYQITELRGYVDTSDVIGTDPYPVPGPLGMAAEWTRLTREASFGTQPVWQVPQAFDWGLFRANTPSNEVACGSNRMPTLGEMRSMAWQCIAEGANGLVFFSYTALEKMNWRMPYEKAWGDVKRLATELDRFIPVFLSDPLLIPSIKGISARAWRKDGDVWMLFCNPTSQPVAASTVAPAATVMDIELGSGVKHESGRLDIKLAPYGFALVRFVRGDK